MSRNGSGTYSLPAGNPVVTNTTISSTWANSTLTDIASALTGSVAADGQTPITGSLNLNSNKIINLATPTLDTDGATKLYVDTADTTNLALSLLKANNLSDVANTTTSRTNLSAAKSGANSDITSITGLTTALAASQGGTGLTSAGASGNVLVSNGTTWTSATGNVRGGITTVTLSTASPSATLTSASNQYIRVVLDTTVPYLPSIVMPDMTTLVTGQGYFVISNETGLALAIKDTGGTIREYLPSSGSYTLNITSIATATGVWYFQNSPALLASYSGPSTLIPRSSYMVAPSNLSVYTSGVIIRLDSTNFAYVYTESGQTATYATLFTVNTTTGAFTVGNKITVVATSYSNFAWDTDNAGHALVAMGSGNTLGSFGLSVSGGILYASALNTVSQGSYTASGPYVAYLGSNSAYAYGCEFTQAIGCCGTTYYTHIRGGTVTGTTSVTYTQSASNTLFQAIASSVRTSLTTFIIAARYVSCTPSANTFTQGARTTASDAESAGANRISGQQGWTYCTGKILQNGSVYDVTNAGTASVLANTSTSYQAKTQLSTNYLTVNGATLNAGYGTTGSTYLVSSSKVILLGTSGLVQNDPTSSTMNISVSGGSASAINTPVPTSMTTGINLFLSGTYGISSYNPYPTTTSNLYLQGIPVATSIV